MAVGLLLPRGLKSLTLGSASDQCLDDMAWPPALAHLQLGHSFNQDIDGVRWPSTLREIYFGNLFRSPITQARREERACVRICARVCDIFQVSSMSSSLKCLLARHIY